MVSGNGSRSSVLLVLLVSEVVRHRGKILELLEVGKHAGRRCKHALTQLIQRHGEGVTEGQTGQRCEGSQMEEFRRAQ